ncbi:hypothetical protein PV327_010213 [Microctonus hyperodae]|uniref:Cerebellar degeneration-related protein 2 n=1 Tax=Microctonus hyperodae TaxID=165561 RepID=A0AA39KUP4_MICHY|nr:hypothetical protein PV327_010213 [Microctonus hyperodae]
MKMNGSTVDVVWEPTTQLSSLECWDYSIELACLKGPEDLQLAAELGKTLLERNKELETNLKSHQTTIEEQTQEIEYLKKQNAALREVTDSRLKVYEQLEVSIQDLERANHRLVVDNTASKKLIKSQTLTIENLEAKCEEFQRKIDDLKNQHENLIRQQQQQQQQTVNHPNGESQLSKTWKTTISKDGSIIQTAANSPSKSSLTASDKQTTLTIEEEVTDLLRQLQETRSQRAREQKKVSELREQLETILKENRGLEEQLTEWRNKAQDMNNLQDEINTLEEVRQGKLCGRCLRSCDTRTHDELSIMLDAEEDDDMSLVESFLNDNQRESESIVQDTGNEPKGVSEVDANPYRVLVEKYEALLEVQRHPSMRRKASVPTPCISLQEELEMSGDFNSFQNTTSDHETTQENGKTNGNSREQGLHGKKPFSGTPTDFSEAETSSSGFSDETSNKGTQTDGGRPGSLLCSIADGEDCKFSIYDDNSPFESRFRKTPEYRQLFSEIFGVLKRAAEAKDEGEKLPLLDNTLATEVAKIEQDDQSEDYTDDNQSVLSSIISSVVSEPVIRVHTPTPEKNIGQKTEVNNEKNDSTPAPRYPHRRHQLEYLSVQVRKKNTVKKNTQKKLTYNDRSTTPDIIPMTNPRILQSKSNSGGRRNKFRPLTAAEQDGNTWNGNTIHIFSSRNKESPPKSHRFNSFQTRNTEQNNSGTEYKEYKPSSASEEVARLRRLEMSYAEALRMPNKPKANNSRRF